MADRTWVDSSNDLGVGYDGVPVDTDSAFILTGETDIVNGLDKSTIDLVDWKIGGGFVGNIGIPGSPAYYGIMTGKVIINKPIGEAHIRVVSVPKLFVVSSPEGSYGVHIFGGTIPDLYILGGRKVRIGAGCVLGNVYIGNEKSGGLQVHVDPGSTLSGVCYVDGGVVNCHAAWGIGTGSIVARGSESIFNHYPPDSSTIAYVRTTSGAKYNPFGKLTIYTLVESFGKGSLWNGQVDSDKKTITVGNAYSGGVIDGRNEGGTILTVTGNEYGGLVLGAVTTHNPFVPGSSGGVGLGF